MEIDISLNPIEFDFSYIREIKPSTNLVWKPNPDRNNCRANEDEHYRSLVLVDSTSNSIAGELRYYRRFPNKYDDHVVCQLVIAGWVASTGRSGGLDGNYTRAEYSAYSHALVDINMSTRGRGEADFRGFEPEYAFMLALAEFLKIKDYKILSIFKNKGVIK